MAINNKIFFDQSEEKVPTGFSVPISMIADENEREEDIQDKERPMLSLIFIALVCFTGLIFYCVLNTSLQTPFNLNNKLKRNASYFLPQGWAFFTRDAREEKLWAYKRLRDGSLVPLNPPGGSSKYLFGINREGRKLPSEYNSLLGKIDSASWNHVEFDLPLIASESMGKKIFHADNKGGLSDTKGEIVFVKKRVTPWAWSRFKSVKMPSKYVRIYVD